MSSTGLQRNGRRHRSAAKGISKKAIKAKNMAPSEEATMEDSSENVGSGEYQPVHNITKGMNPSTSEHFTRPGSETITGTQATVTNTQITDDSYSTRPLTDQPNRTSSTNSTHLGRHATAEPQQTGLAIGE